MWRLEKPDLETAKKDIPRLIGSDKRLVESDQAVLEELYDLYERNHGCVTDEEHDRIPPGKQEALRSLYDKTYEGGSLGYIRSSLMDKVIKCPYCSINTPSWLDHYMPKSRYKALSVCRLNLVPMCGDCNIRKSDDSYDRYIHPYYYAGPGVPEFLVVEVTVIPEQGLSLKLSVSPQVKDPRQRSILENHIERFHLKTRISHELNIYLCDLFKDPYSSDEALKTSLNHFLEKEKELYGRDDWRTALLRGLILCKDFDAKAANSFFHRRSTAVNGGAGL